MPKKTKKYNFVNTNSNKNFAFHLIIKFTCKMYASLIERVMNLIKNKKHLYKTFATKILTPH